ncbi:MAG: dockerin type I domain-containing protein [Pirellulaceae bacterium]|nr:hypothetical protein [Planctomycetales bacterium]
MRRRGGLARLRRAVASRWGDSACERLEARCLMAASTANASLPDGPVLTTVADGTGEIEELSGWTTASERFTDGFPTIRQRNFLRYVNVATVGNPSEWGVELTGSRTTRDRWSVNLAVEPGADYELSLDLRIDNRRTYTYTNLDYPDSLMSLTDRTQGVWAGRYSLQVDGVNVLNPTATSGQVPHGDVDWFREVVQIQAGANQRVVKVSLVLEGFDGKLTVDNVRLKKVIGFYRPENHIVPPLQSGHAIAAFSPTQIDTSSATFKITDRAIHIYHGGARVAQLDFASGSLTQRSVSANQRVAWIRTPKLAIAINADSSFFVYANADLQFQVLGAQRPYHYMQVGQLLVSNGVESFAFAPIRSRAEYARLGYTIDSTTGDRLYNEVAITRAGLKNWRVRESLDANNQTDWGVFYTAARGDAFVGAINANEAFYDRDFSTDEVDVLRGADATRRAAAQNAESLNAFRDNGKSVALLLWPQYAASRTYGPIPVSARFTTDLAGDLTPADVGALQQLAEQAHRRGIKLILYASPYYYHTTDIDAFVENLQQIMADTGVDGFYLDGLYRNDVWRSLKLMSDVREALGDDAYLALHLSRDPGLMTQVKLPIYETLADVVWTGENVPTLTVEYLALNSASGVQQVLLPETRFDGQKRDLPIGKQIDLALAHGIKVRENGVLNRALGKREVFPVEYYRQQLQAARQPPTVTPVTVVSPPKPRSNPRNRFDVNDDGLVSPLDVLLVADHLSYLTKNAVTPSNPPDAAYQFFYDVNGDGIVTTIDILRIIDHLDQLARQRATDAAFASS